MSDLLGLIDPRAALLLHVSVAAVMVAAILLVAGLLRERSTPGFGVYESGAPPNRAMTTPLAAPYFLIAVAFMIFDMEVAILFAWAIAARETGTDGLIAATVFIVVLLAALLYLWLDGALETGPRRSAHMTRGRT